MGKFTKIKAGLCCFFLCLASNPAAAGGPGIRFEEIGAKAGVRVQHHTRMFHGKNADVLRMFTSGGAAVAVGDYDNDGFEDIFVTDSDAGKPNHLFHNNGNMTFTHVAVKTGVAGGKDPPSVGTEAVWIGYDNDGKLDLLVRGLGRAIPMYK